MAATLTSYTTESAQAWDSYDWCNNYYNNYYDPSCAYPYPYGGFFFGDNDHRRFHHRFDHDHHFDHDHDHHFGGFHHGGMGHGGMAGHNGGGPGGSHR